MIRNSSHRTRKITSDGGKQMRCILETGSVESFIRKRKLKWFSPSAIVKPTQVKMKGATGHTLKLAGETIIPIQPIDEPMVRCKFLVSHEGPLILGLNSMIDMRVSLAFTTHGEETPRVHSRADLVRARLKVAVINLYRLFFLKISKSYNSSLC